MLEEKLAIRVLVVDDEKPIRTVLSDTLEDEGYKVAVAENGEQALQAIKDFSPHVVFLDIWMPGPLDGLQTLERAQKQGLNTEFIMMSGHGTIETAVKATRLGAWDFLEKPLSMDKVFILIKNVLNLQSEKREKMALLNKLRSNIAIIGESMGMKEVKERISRVASSDSCVLITGENGTGKELVAQNIHFLSDRASAPFVEINCAAIPEDLIESELFGYEKGAFTGATRLKKGKFDLADGGTVFLDEIGDMSLSAQAKILRVLQEKEFTRVGGNEKISVDVRILAATNKNLAESISQGQFREDLFYRLNVIPFSVPPLRQRKNDIPSLVTFFGQFFAKQSGNRIKTISQGAMDILVNHSWPGNVRELKNFMERLYILSPGETIEVADVVYAGLNYSSADVAEGSSNFREARAVFEKEYIIKKIAENRGNISRTAEEIGLERSYLHRKIKAYEIDVERLESLDFTEAPVPPEKGNELV